MCKLACCDLKESVRNILPNISKGVTQKYFRPILQVFMPDVTDLFSFDYMTFHIDTATIEKTLS